jgi:hypothetical protein
MDEGDPASHAPWPGHVIHHPHPPPAQVRYCFIDVRDLHGDVVQSRSPSVKETGDSPRPGHLEQLEIGIPGRKHALNESFGMFFMRAYESEEAANDLGRVVSPVRESNVVKAGDLPGAVCCLHGSPSRAPRGRKPILRDILL